MVGGIEDSERVKPVNALTLTSCIEDRMEIHRRAAASVPVQTDGASKVNWEVYGTVSSILLLNTDVAVAPLSLASSGILASQKFDYLIDWLILSSCTYSFPN